MSIANETVCTDEGLYLYHIRRQQAVITFIPANIYNRRRTNTFNVSGPVATLVSADRARAHLNDVQRRSMYAYN